MNDCRKNILLKMFSERKEHFIDNMHATNAMFDYNGRYQS